MPTAETTKPTASPRPPATSSAPTTRHSCAPTRNWSRISNDCLAPASFKPPEPRNATARRALRTMVAMCISNLSLRVVDLTLGGPPSNRHAGSRRSLAHALHHRDQPGEIEFVVVTQSLHDVEDHPWRWVGAQEFPVDRRSPLVEPGCGQRGPAGFDGVVEQVAVGEVLHHQLVGIVPVVEDLTAQNVAAHAPDAFVPSV